MKPEIKQRIEQIRKGEVPQGYKETKIGIIPIDWAIKKLGQLAKFYKGKGLSKGEILEDGEYKCVHYGELFRKYQEEIKQIISCTNKLDNMFISKKNDVLMPTSDITPNGLATASCIKEEGVILGGDILVIRVQQEELNGSYLSYSICYEKKQILRLISGITVFHLYRGNMSQFIIRIPQKEEQLKIVKIISEWNQLIELKEKLISEKKVYRKGFIQKLVYNKHSKSVPDGWFERILKQCLIPTSYPVDKPTRVYDALGIRSHCKGTMVKPVDDPSKVDMDTLYEVKENELIVNITFAWEGAIAILNKKDEGKLVSHRFPTFKFNEAYALPDYFEHLIKTKWFVFQLGIVSPGGAGRNRVLSKKEFLKIRLVLPSVEQQNKIANFLDSLDQEINLLKEELDKLKEQKKGLMQLLLTGIVRVNVEDNKNAN